MTTAGSATGGCQCGAVRYEVGAFGRASICHCRMCQKAFGNAFAPLVTAKSITFTRGTPKHFQSSSKARRGFCGSCGTPLTYEFEGFGTEIAICTLDDPSIAAPVLQVGLESRIPWCEGLDALPTRAPEEAAKAETLFKELVSNQHPDHDTENWPVQENDHGN
ncbi:GFA family protein [uncultured Roseibium sp.]|uniref:GFA family protein n=1 Tax=uncultured Roseibium sp. TaxID=1936171 RepID=UPI003217B295